ncbi:hypothetical protein OG280_37310 [Streptomyces virginiae]|uniref:hypothetical protein n=1 Tax=Streptomyces virginiae TaxID=1961 RepID=UPI00324FA311
MVLRGLEEEEEEEEEEEDEEEEEEEEEEDARERAAQRVEGADLDYALGDREAEWARSQKSWRLL